MYGRGCHAPVLLLSPGLGGSYTNVGSEAARYLLFRAQPPHSLRHSPGVMYTWPQCLATFPAASGKLPSDSPFPETCAEKASLTVYKEGSITR